MHDRETVIRTCLVCDLPYLGGTYREHQRKHPRRVTAGQARILALIEQGHTQAEVARIVGVSRQRVNEIVRRVA